MIHLCLGLGFGQSRGSPDCDGPPVFREQELCHIDIALTERTLAPPQIKIPHALEALVKSESADVFKLLEKPFAPDRQPAPARDALETQHPDADTELHYKTAFELLVATILSAQSTDVRVNLVTPALFKRYRDARALANAMDR